MRLAGRYGWAVGVFGLCVAAGYLRLTPLTPRSAPAKPYPITTTGDERLMVYIGSSTCGPSNDPDLPAQIATLRARIAQSARRDGRRFVTVGIAKDVDVPAGLAHLAKVGDFDEVMAGRSWANIGIMKYVFEDQLGPAATPQVLVVDRHMNNQGVFVEILGETVLRRRVGLQELREWVSKPDDVALYSPGNAHR